MHTSLKAVFVICVAVAMAHSDTTSTEARLKKLGESIQEIANKAGISLGGEFRSEYFASTLSGASRNRSGRSTESNEYTSVDFDIRARPNSAIQGRLMFRMHQNWQNFFSDISNPIFSRWISIDGTVNDVFSYHAGDLRANYGSLILASPDVEILNEPEVFSQYRTLAQSERFLGNKDRVLRGATINFDAEVAPIFNEGHIGVIGMRLRSIETSIMSGSEVTGLPEAAPIEKYATGINADLLFLNGLSLGGTYLQIFDNHASYRGSDSTADTLAQNTRIIGVRPAVQIGRLLGTTNWDASLSADAAFSTDDTLWWDSVISATDTSLILFDSTIGGMALKVGVSGGFKLDNQSVRIGVDYLSNSQYFRNELAQSPSFIGTRIMNSDNDIGNPKLVYQASSYHYSTFDAIYGNVFKFAPVERTNLEKAPFQKNSYTNAIFNQQELDAMKGKLDPSLQLIMPFGPATANRQGIRGNVTLELLNKGLEIKGLFASLAEEKGLADLAQKSTTHDTVTTDPVSGIRDTNPTTHDTLIMAEFPATAFLQYGGGVKFDVSSIAAVLKFPLIVSGSYVHSAANNAGPSLIVNNQWSITSDFINAGVYYKFWKNAAVMLGYQQIVNAQKRGIGFKYTQTQSHYGLGLEYRVAEGAFIAGTLRQIVVKNSNDSVNPDSGSINDFEQFQAGLLLKVKF